MKLWQISCVSTRFRVNLYLSKGVLKFIPYISIRVTNNNNKKRPWYVICCDRKLISKNNISKYERVYN